MHCINLASKLEDLLASGLTYKLIALRAGCEISTIYRIKKGEIDNPRYSVGVAIDELHAGLRETAEQRAV